MTGRFRQVFVGSNLKMYKTNQQTLDYLDRLQSLTWDIPRTELVLFFLPSYPALPDACRAADHSLVLIGAQNVHWASSGQYTGEVSPPMLQEIGVDLIMVGHAERRQLFGETDWMVNKRVLSSLGTGFRTLICIGDTAEDMDYGISAERLQQQLKIALHCVRADQLSKVWVAYEPVWAIGEGSVVAEPAFANEMHAVIHATLDRLYPGGSPQVPVLYGGSVNLSNAAELVVQPDIDGLFIGRAAWEAGNFNAILRSIMVCLAGDQVKSRL
jgi:triosephosphate isomerase